IIEIAEDEALIPNYSADSGLPKNQVAVARILKAYAFHILTDTYGPVPYHSYGTEDEDFQALQTEKGIYNPKYAPEEKIYKDLLKELKEAAEMIDVSQKAFNEYDRIYNGDSKKWKKFANSLRLRVAMRMRAKDKALADQHIEDALASGVFESNEDNAKYHYESSDSKASPWYTTVVIENRNDFSVSNMLMGLLKGEKGSFGILDPRVEKFADPNKNGEYVGQPYGVPINDLATEASALASLLDSVRVHTSNYPEIYMEYAEVEFILSEYKNWSQEHYEKGIRASMERWGVAESAISAYLAAVPAANMENVMNQKYIASFLQPNNAWAELRRTGYPDFLIKKGDFVYKDLKGKDHYFEPKVDVDDIPARLTYPWEEQRLNESNYKGALDLLGGPDQMKTKIWWMK
ncbi:MAG: SusD/RagB family nutrient-binding outer membrane lipoprotein, partial [Cytophagales bacterium]|nr:SusD/RagB family nutrient-binding outer membrane lipoprotein [Cytophagales bacterium]